MYSRKRNWVANEELTTDLSEVEVPALAEMPSETVESQELEASVAEREADALDQDAQELSADQDNLAQLTNSVEDSQANGGLDETAAEVVEIAAEAFCAKWSVTPTKVAKEGFSESVTRLQSTSFALESLKSASSSLWERFLQLLQSIIDKLKDVWFNFSNAGKSLEKRAAKLKQALEKIPDDATPSESNVGGSWIKDLTIGGKFDETLVLNFATSKKYSDGNLGYTLASGVKIALEISPIFREKENNTVANKLENIIKSAITGYSNIFKRNIGMIPSSATDETTVAFPGNVIYFIYRMPHSDGEGTYCMSSYCVADETISASKLPTLTKDKIVQYIDALGILAKSLENTIKGFRDYDAAIKHAKGVMEDMAKDTDSTKAEKDRMLKNMRCSILALQTTSKVQMLAMRCCANGLSGYVSASIKAYK